MFLKLFLFACLASVSTVLAAGVSIEELFNPSFEQVLPVREAGPLTKADGSWLCIGEHEAKVSHVPGRVVSSNSSFSDDKIIVSKDGVQPFGGDSVIIKDCQWTQNNLIACGRKTNDIADQLVGLKLIIDVDGVFTFSGSNASVDLQEKVWVFEAFLIKGTCRQQ